MGSKSVPEVRFKGFSGEWDECKIVDVLNINSGKDYKHLKKGNIPVYGTGGYMHSVNDKLSDDDAIGIGRKGTINKPQLLLAPFWTVDTLFYMTVKG
ncbi:restriction endonuclease subunit S, partial [Bacillus altitudinis]